MERFIWTHQSDQPFYVFDEKHIVHLWDDGISIHRAGKCYKDVKTRLSPFDGPHFYLKALPLAFFKNIVLGRRLPISLRMEGDDLGTVKRTSGFGHVDGELKSGKRRIVRQEIRLSVASDFFVINVTVHAGAVDARTATGQVKDDKRPQSYRFKFPFPMEIVPEVLNLTETERRAFQHSRSN